MKKIFLLTALAVMVLASCNRNEEEMGSVGGEKATLVISIKSPEMRTAEAVADFDDIAKPKDEILNYTVFIIDQGDRVMDKKYTSGSGTTEMNVTTQAKTVYVVANADDLAAAASSPTTLEELNEYIIDLNGTTTLAGKQTLANKRWATGSAAIDFVQQADNTFAATPTVYLTFVAARIKVKIVAAGDMAAHYNPSATAANGSLVLTKVAVLNARGQSLLFGTPSDDPDDIQTSLIPTYAANKKYYEGLENPAAPDNFNKYPTDGNFTYDASTATLLSDNIATADYTANAFTKMYYYYVFENDAIAAANQPTIVVIEGMYGQDDERKPIYFPVHLAPYEQLSTGSPVSGILRGNSYNITITLNGDPRYSEGGEYPGDTGGTEDPTDPVVTAKVTVTVQLTPWNPVGIGKQFGN